VLHYYDWSGGTPFEVQRRTVAVLTTNKRAYVLNGLGTGKTKAAIWAFDWLRQAGEAKRMLVVAPLSTLNFTWAKEVFATTPHLRCHVLYGSVARRRELLEQEADIYVINYDGARVLAPELLARKDIDVVVLDELALLRNARAARTRVMAQLVARREWVWGMTGSPTPQAPTDAWAQARLLTPDRVPKYFKAFRDMTMVQVSQFKWAPRRDAMAIVADALQPATRFSLSDVVELPQVVTQHREVPPSPLQRQVYDAMMKHFVAQVKNGAIVAVNSAVQFGKLLQIALGWAYDRAGAPVFLEAEQRMEAIEQAVLEAEGKAIVFVTYKHAMSAIADRLRDTLGGDVGVINGDTPPRERAETFRMFQFTDTPRVLVAAPQAMSHGVTLTAANVVIWAGPPTSLEVFEQANARISRVGQTRKQLVITLSSFPAEKLTYARLQARAGLQTLLLDMVREMTNDV
jgi:SNF2 family DNA or RNA helicase